MFLKKRDSLVEIPEGGSFNDMLKLKGKSDTLLLSEGLSNNIYSKSVRTKVRA